MTHLFSTPSLSEPSSILAASSPHSNLSRVLQGKLTCFLFIISATFIFLPFWCSLILRWWSLSSIFSKSLSIPLSTSCLDYRCFLVSFMMMFRLCFLFYLLFRKGFWEYRSIEISLHIHLNIRSLQLYPQISPRTSRASTLVFCSIGHNEYTAIARISFPLNFMLFITLSLL